MIEVVQPGLFTTVQDKGRWGYQAYGVPVAGAMDRYAHRAANLLVGNAPDEATLEMTLMGGTYRFTASVWVAVCGADMKGTLDGAPIQNWSSLFVPAGAELSFQYAVQGCRTYLAIPGGVDVPLVLGSRSTYTRGGIGGVEGRALKSGDVLTAPPADARGISARTLPAELVPVYGEETVLRVLLGPQDDFFTPAGLDALFGGRYVISDEADRMGYRLEGDKIEHGKKPDIVSDALCQGAIQVPGHGMPIVMMADRQTTGGYAKIGAVIGPDLSRLAQAKPGDAVRFVLCTDGEAVAALRAEQACYDQMARWMAAERQPTGAKNAYRLTINGVAYNVTVEELK